MMRGMRIRIRTTPDGMRSAESMPRTWSARISPFRLRICPSTSRESRVPSGVSVMPKLRAMPAKMSQTVLLEKGPKAVSNVRTPRTGKRTIINNELYSRGTGSKVHSTTVARERGQGQAGHGADVGRIQHDDQRQKDGQNQSGGGFSGHSTNAGDHGYETNDGK